MFMELRVSSRIGTYLAWYMPLNVHTRSRSRVPNSRKIREKTENLNQVRVVANEGNLCASKHCTGQTRISRGRYCGKCRASLFRVSQGKHWNACTETACESTADACTEATVICADLARDIIAG